MAVAMNPNIMRRMMKLVISTLAFAVSMYLIIWWFFTPTMLGWTIEMLVTQHTQKFGDMVGVYLLYTCPIIILALLGTLHLHLRKKSPPSLKPKKSNNDSFYSRASRMWRMLWTRPLFINCVFGVMTVVDLVAIISTLILVFWLFYVWYVPQAKLIDVVSSTTGVDKVVAKTAQAGTMLGRVSAVLMSLLLLPVTRNSPILCMLGLPFEQAVKYHKWVGYLLVAVILGHGGSFIGVYAKTHMWHQLISFTAPPNGSSGVVVVPGLIAFLIAIYMVATSLPTIRRRHFNFFYYSHQLYVVFFASFVYHVGVRTAGYTMGPLFLFFLDRFMRFWQSRQLIQVSQARVSFDGIIELKVPRSSTLTYDALSFVFLKVPGVSHLEWHPISIASSARDRAGEMTIHIKKVAGGTSGKHSWTSQVAAHVTELANMATEKRCPFSMPIAVEGPYGDESDYYLNYKTLVLVAGGIGITPFVAIIQDILHRYRITAHEERDHLPKNIVLIWSVRSETELDILRQVSPSLTFGDYELGACRIHVKAYVTRFQTNKAYVDNNVDNNLGGAIHVIPAPGPDDDLTNTSCVRSVTGTGDNLWMFWMILITSCATVAMFEGINVVPRNTPYFQWIQVSLLFVSMFVGIVVAGSAVLLCWTAHSKSKERITMENQARDARVVGLHENELLSVDDMEWAHPTLYDMAEEYMFSRPDFSREFDQVVKDFGHEDVGVLVSGQEGLQHVVAKECQRWSGLHATLKGEIFNYHSISFSL